MQTLFCRCGQRVFCDNTLCESCGRTLGFDPITNIMHSLDSQGDGLYSDEKGNHYRLCGNREQHNVCNGLVLQKGEVNGNTTNNANGDKNSSKANGGTSANGNNSTNNAKNANNATNNGAADDAPKTRGLCTGCVLNRALPSLERSENILRWSRLERAKRRLISGLSSLGLDLHAPTNRGLEQMGFKFLEDQRSDPNALETFVSTGHKDGIITINLLEADEVQRVQQREMMGERYRTLLGHFRHEAGHFYYQRLIGDSDEFSQLFGDPQADYGDTMNSYYQQGPPADWEQHWISAYASSHPWEDWAESFAHYLHIEDCLETAWAQGWAPGMMTATDRATPAERLQAWGDFVISLNEVSRALGVRDTYPFLLSAGVRAKLEYVGRCIARACAPQPLKA